MGSSPPPCMVRANANARFVCVSVECRAARMRGWLRVGRGAVSRVLDDVMEELCDVLRQHGNNGS